VRLLTAVYVDSNVYYLAFVRFASNPSSDSAAATRWGLPSPTLLQNPGYATGVVDSRPT